MLGPRSSNNENRLENPVKDVTQMNLGKKVNEQVKAD